MRLWISLGSFILALVLGTFIFSKLAGSNFSFGRRADVEIDWRLLQGLDYVTGAAPKELQSLDGKMVKIPGFMVPLEDNSKLVTQFLLVPSPQACIHVPPPPPNQMLLINFKEGTDVLYGPIWVHGVLRIAPKRTMFGEASFEVEATLTEPYE